MTSARVRFAVEAAALIVFGAVLAVADVGLAAFAVAMAVAWLVVAALERTVLHPRREPGAAPLDAWPPADAGADGGREARDDDGAAALRAPPEDAAPPLVIAEREEEAVEPAADAEPEPAAALGVEAPSPPASAPVGEQGNGGGAGVEPGVEHEPAAEPEPQRAPVQLVEAPPPEPEPVPTPSPVVALPRRGDAGWNLWDLERRARERAGEDAWRDEEWAALFVYLREYASPDGMLPAEFDDLVRESFAELLAAERA